MLVSLIAAGACSVNPHSIYTVESAKRKKERKKERKNERKKEERKITHFSCLVIVIELLSEFIVVLLTLLLCICPSQIFERCTFFTCIKFWSLEKVP